MSEKEEIRPAQITDQDGHPYSAEFGDIYASRQGAVGQALHVFIKGNKLPQAWQNRPSFVILENGFGLGTNFLTTLKTWREDPHRSDSLHFVSIEKFPASKKDLLRFADPEVTEEAAELAEQWPDCVPGVHRLYFNDGRVVLTLYFMDVAFASKKLALKYDALYLDGFSPAKNDAMWKRSVLTSLSKFAKQEATLATWCVSSHVRVDLRNAGFEVQKVQGFGKKSQMTVGVYRPRFSHRRSQGVPYTGKYPDRSILIIGAGMAGTACACEFARRGWKVTVIDEGRVAASAASAIRYAIAHFQPAGDENLLFRLSRVGFDVLREISRDFPEYFHLNGLPQIARDEAEYKKWEKWFQNNKPFRFPENFLRLLSREEVSAIIGYEASSGALLHPTAGLVEAGRFVRDRLFVSGASCLFNSRVSGLTREEGKWVAHGAAGEELARASVCILCPGSSLLKIASDNIPVTNWHGRLSLLSGEELPKLKGAVTGPGYIINDGDNWVGVGATYEREGSPMDEREAHKQNAEKLYKMLPNAGFGTAIGFYEGIRSAPSDRLPLIGNVPPGFLTERFVSEKDSSNDALFLNTGMGSRGLIFSDLGARIIAAQVTGEPYPIEKDLLDAVNPARFLGRT